MTIQVELLTPSDHAAYEQFLHTQATAMLFQSWKYRAFLERVLPQSEAFYLIARDGAQIVGALPAFLRRNAAYGSVLNSLPFFGSNGGILTTPENRLPIQTALLDAFYALARQEHAVASTIISNPLEPDQQIYETHTDYTYRDERIGQVAPLPDHWSGSNDLAQQLMAQYHKKTRNAVRKAQISGITIRRGGDLDTLRALAALHQENMESMGAKAKPWLIFEAIYATFAYGQDYEVYIAERNGELAAALLVFFYHRTAEYFVPATSREHRLYQPMNGLVFEAMQDAARRGCRSWNWGGTGLTQTSLYQFKSRWGTADRPYYYYVTVHDDHILQCSPETLAQEYPYFYVVPFGKLTAHEKL